MEGGDLVAPAVVAACISGITAYLVARATATSAVESARIAASVERDKLAHSREEFRATRRDMARQDILKLDERMGYIVQADVRTDLRVAATQDAHSLLLSVAMILGDDQLGGASMDQLLKALEDADLESATALWPEIRRAILGSRLPTP